MNWQQKFNGGLAYAAFLEKHGTAAHCQRWQALYEQAELASEQRRLVAGFVREMNVLCLAGAWCGDCVNQCPILQRIAEASRQIDLRFIDRDIDAELRDALSINGGQRVPMVVFLSEDFHECGRCGDRTLSKYREMALSQIGPACPVGGGATKASIAAVTQEWLNEFERVQLMLYLSPRLRSKHGD